MTDKTSPLVTALFKIASYPRGGTIIAGTPEGDRDEMIGAARQALVQHYRVPTWGAVLARLHQDDHS